MEDIERIRKLLQKLADFIYSVTIDCKKQGILEPEYTPYIRHKVIKFEYGESGITNKVVEPVEFSLPTWRRAGLDMYYDRIDGHKVLKDALIALENSSFSTKMLNPEMNVRSLTMGIVDNTLKGRISHPEHLSKYVDLFIKYLNEDEYEREYKIDIYLKGLILQPNLIRLDGNTILRKPVRKDLEIVERKRRPVIPPRPRPLKDPTAILNTVIHAKPETDLGPEIDRGIQILRLFGAGSVQSIRDVISEDPIHDIEPTEYIEERLLGQDNYLINKQDVKRLKAFWLRVKNIDLPIPAEKGVPKEPTSLAISYERYSNALDETIFENRIFSAVMGLEALYLTEKQEMSYRLRMRVAKLLGLLGYNQDEVREKIKDAYDIRSTYVHGEILKQKDKRTIERNHGDLQEFSKTIIDYLRASIVALLERPSKTRLIKEIDDSFLYNNKEKEVKKLLFMPYEKES